ncbi:MAG: DUF928 domain-containing protein [Xenococcaceae cyanobacterium MO_188.B32]|nr:DUF928 domain-containing protein [Xenococcaceae cyanobacterium MO_188.B32]
MIWQKYYQSMGILTIVISQVVTVISGFPSRLLAQSSSMIISLEFPPTNKRGAPETTAGGGTRTNSCIKTYAEAEEIPLTPLMPNRTNVGLTATTSPILYWYIPENTAELGKFLVKDDLGNEVYSATFELPSTAGIIKLGIPKNADLKTDRDYFWTLSLVCNSQDRLRDYAVEGVLQPTEIDLSLKLQLAGKTLLEQAELYAQQRIWHDALDIVAQLSTENPEEWEEFLSSIDLEKIAKKPILACCKAENSSVLYLNELLE